MMNPSLGAMTQGQKKSTPLERALRSVASKSTGSNSSNGDHRLSDIDMKLLYGLVSAKKQKIPKRLRRGNHDNDPNSYRTVGNCHNDQTVHKTAAYNFDYDPEEEDSNGRVPGGTAKVKGILRGAHGMQGENPFKQSITALSMDYGRKAKNSGGGVKWGPTGDNVVDGNLVDPRNIVRAEPTGVAAGTGGPVKKSNLKQNSDLVVNQSDNNLNTEKMSED